MVDLPQVNPAQLGNGIANLAKKGISNFADSTMGNLDTIDEGAKLFGITGLGSIFNSLKTFVYGLLAKIGIHAGTAETPAATAAATPPATPNPAAAQAAAATAAAGNHAAGGTHVAAAGAPPVTPATPKPPRAVS